MQVNNLSKKKVLPYYILELFFVLDIYCIKFNYVELFRNIQLQKNYIIF